MPRYAIGHRFPAQTIVLKREDVQAYLAATQSESPLYRGDSDATPPLAIAAWVLAGLIKEIGLPPGSVHASQEFRFAAAAPVGGTIAAEAEVVQSAMRGGMDVIVVEIRASHAQNAVLSGRSMLMMPASEENR